LIHWFVIGIHQLDQDLVMPGRKALDNHRIAAGICPPLNDAAADRIVAMIPACYPSATKISTGLNLRRPFVTNETDLVCRRTLMSRSENRVY
jgi:hypothetical protein